MTSGGRRNRGNRPDPNSGRSDKRNYSLSLKALPASGYAGVIPDFPLADASEREIAVWRQLWRTPQACAWSTASEAWRVPTVGLYVRLRVRCEDKEAGASLLAQLHRFADQIGLTPAGLAENGWTIAASNSEDADRPSKPASTTPKGSRARLQVVGGVTHIDPTAGPHQTHPRASGAKEDEQDQGAS